MTNFTTWTFLLSKQKNTSTWAVSKKGITAGFFAITCEPFPLASWKSQNVLENVLHEQNSFFCSCTSSSKNTRTWDVLWNEETTGFVLEAWRSKANSENVLKNVLQLTKVSFLASLQRKHTHMGCFMKGGNNCPWCLLWNNCNSRECFQECSTTNKVVLQRKNVLKNILVKLQIWIRMLSFNHSQLQLRHNCITTSH